MAVDRTTVSLLLAVLSVAVCTAEESSHTLDTALQLTIESRHIQNSSSTQVVRCGLSHQVHQVKVTDLSLLLDGPCDVTDTYHLLAHLDIWTQQPILESQFLKFNVSGYIDLDDDANTYLSVSQDTPSHVGHRTFKCVVQGVNSEGHPVTAFEIVREESSPRDHLIEALSQEVETIDRTLEEMVGHFETIETLENITCTKPEILSVSNQLDELNAVFQNQAQVANDQLEAIQQVVEDHRTSAFIQYSKDEIMGETLASMNDSLENQLQNLTDNLESIRAVVEDSRSNQIMDSDSHKAALQNLESKLVAANEDLASDVNNLADNLQTVESIVEALHLELKSVSTSVDHLLKVLPERNRNSTATYSSSFFRKLHPSNVFRGRTYLFTEKVKTFNVSTATELCKSHGGYLVEVDDDEEFEFLNENVKYFDEDFFTGFSDIKEEGKFVHMHSGYIMRINQWAPNQPNSYDGDQDCVEIFKDGSGFNDEKCIVNDASFICEIPN